MKKLLFLALGAAVLGACSSKPTDAYTINGTTDLADGEMIFMSYQLDADSTFVDSVEVANGTFAFNGAVEYPRMAYISHGKPKYIDETVRPIMIENAVIAIDLKGDTYSEAPVTGSPSTQEMDSLKNALKVYTDEMKAMGAQYDSIANDKEKLEVFMAKYEELNNNVKNEQINFVKTHPASYYTPLLMRTLSYGMTLDEMKEIYNTWTPEVKAADSYIGQRIEALEAVQPGKQAPEIAGKDQNDKDVSLSGLKGKVVLLDFWATWCGPCRASLPHVKEVYEKYHDKGLEVLCVSLDRDEAAWKDYIANSGMGMENYNHVYERGCFWNSKDAKNYAVNAIPAKFLIDAEGNIIANVSDDEVLNAKLAEIFD